MRILENPVALIALILLVVLLFGAKRMPDIARSVGSSLKIFKKEVKELREDDDKPQSDAGTASPTTGETSGATTSGSEDTTSSASGSGEPKNT